MDSTPSNQQQQSFGRRIKQRETTQHQPQHIRVQSNHHHHENRSRSWFSSSNSRNSKENKEKQQQQQCLPQPTVKILAKSAKTSDVSNTIAAKNEHEINSIINDSINILAKSVLTKPKPSVAVLEKNIQVSLNLPSSSSAIKKHCESTPKCIKLVDFEFNFVQPEPSIIDSMLMPDFGSNLVTNTASNSNLTANSSLSNQSSSSNNTANQQPNLSFGGQTFCVVAAVGMDGTGKSSLLNKIAQCDAFQTRSSVAHKNRENPLSHVTNGIDLHITSERVFLLDTQPLLSASVLDDLIRINTERMSSGGSSGMNLAKHFYNSLMSTPIFSSVVGFDIAETENFAFIYSLQLLTYLITICDHVILVIDSLTLDAHLFKLLATAMMIVGDAVMSKANIIIYLKKTPTTSCGSLHHPNLGHRNQSNLESLYEKAIKTLLGPTVTFDFIRDDEALLQKVLRPPHSRSLVNDQSCSTISHQSERLWLNSVQRFWDSSIRKSSLFSDYARYLP